MPLHSLPSAQRHDGPGCASRLNPYAEYAYDGIYLNPMEVLFVKVKGFTIDGDWTSPKMAATYDRWISQQVSSGALLPTSPAPPDPAPAPCRRTARTDPTKQMHRPAQLSGLNLLLGEVQPMSGRGPRPHEQAHGAGLTSCTHTQGQAGIVNSNDYIQRRSAYRMAKAIVMERRGGRCFDFPFYRARSKDLPPLAEPQLWQHFVKDGQFEGRPFRWACSGLGVRDHVQEQLAWHTGLHALHPVSGCCT